MKQILTLRRQIEAVYIQNQLTLIKQIHARLHLFEHHIIAGLAAPLELNQQKLYRHLNMRYKTLKLKAALLSNN
jgi:hypothetical protein